MAVIREPRVFVERLHFEIRKAVAVNGGIALQAGFCRVVALCGPTGVGKTTNLAKIAADFAVDKQFAETGQIAADFRIGADKRRGGPHSVQHVGLRVRWLIMAKGFQKHGTHSLITASGSIDLLDRNPPDTTV